MKCAACGEENSSKAKFCSNCGARLKPAAATMWYDDDAEETKKPSKVTEEQTYRPRRMPKVSPEDQLDEAEEQPRGQKVFVFDDEEEDETPAPRKKASKSTSKAAGKPAKAKHRADDDLIFPDDEDDEPYDDDDDETPGRGGKIFVAVISLITLLALVVGGILFLYVTPIGGRLRANMGMSSDAVDYKALGDWQLSNGNEADAAQSYYNAFLLNQDDYEFDLALAQGFESCHALERAEQLYMYLMEKYPLENAPYEYLMALLVRQGKEDEYNGLLYYRAEHQPGYVVPVAQKEVTTPTASPAGGTFTGSVHITLTADEGTVIYFTTDGSEPTRASRLYSGPIILYSGNYTIKAVAYDGEATSEVMQEAYTIS